MKAAILYGKGDLRYEDRPDPPPAGNGEITVRILRGGICGSDMHYFLEGGIGSAIRVREPIIIGHEGCGIVETVGNGVTTAKEGDMVAIRPARPCFSCMYCGKSMFTHCENMRHLGSAALLPHTAGLFCDKVLLHESQARVVKNADPAVMAFAEPLAVAYAGTRKLGDVVGKSVLVMGAGPIGALAGAACKTLGAGRVVVVDVRSAPLATALVLGADEAVNSAEDPNTIARWKEHKGCFDCMIEASGNKFAATDGMGMTRPEGVVAQVGSFPAGGAPDNFGPFTTKGLHWHASFRFYDEFGPAVSALERGLINPLPLLSASYPLAECVAAMESAASPKTAKVQVVISE